MADIDWGRAAIEAAASAASGLVGLVVGAYKFGRSSEHSKQAVKLDYVLKIAALRTEVMQVIEVKYAEAGQRNIDLVDQFRETLEGIRRQMDELRYHNEFRFLPKGDFDKFRTEYREDTVRMNDKLDQIIAR